MSHKLPFPSISERACYAQQLNYINCLCLAVVAFAIIVTVVVASAICRRFLLPHIVGGALNIAYTSCENS